MFATALTNLMGARIAGGDSTYKDVVVLISGGIAVDSQRKWTTAHPKQSQELRAAWSGVMNFVLKKDLDCC